jgi:hypothetical protein
VCARALRCFLVAGLRSISIALSFWRGTKLLLIELQTASTRITSLLFFIFVTSKSVTMAGASLEQYVYQVSLIFSCLYLYLCLLSARTTATSAAHSQCGVSDATYYSLHWFFLVLVLLHSLCLLHEFIVAMSFYHAECLD